MALPIWKDYEVNLGNVESADYTIRTGVNDADIIYSGKAWRKPGEADCKIIINDIIADYLGQSFPSGAPFITGLYSCNAIRTFYVFKGSTQVGSGLEFFYDYSYNYLLPMLAPYSMAEPIDGVIDVRMPLIRTMRVTPTDATYFELENSFDKSFDMSFDVINEVTTSIVGQGNYVRVTTNADAGHGITFSNQYEHTTYVFADTCAKWALYYVNEYGGWDSLVMQGGWSQTDNYTRHKAKRFYMNGDNQNRGTYNYANEVGVTYSLRTGLLTDDQASRMHHLIGSTQVFIMDLESGWAYPVIITDNSCEYKTYKNGGNKFVQYTINVEIAKDHTRR